MINIVKNTLVILICLIAIVLIYASVNYLKPFERIKVNNSLYDDVQILTIDKQDFRDLNKNNILDIYEDHRLDAQTRTNDLLSKMSIEEKVGQMFHPPFILKPDSVSYTHLTLPTNC